MTERQKSAISLLAGCFALGALVGAITTAIFMKPDDTPVVVQTHCCEKCKEVENKEPSTEFNLQAQTTKPDTPVKVTQSQKPKTENLGRFKLTAYCICSKCCGEWADGFTYTGTEATPGRTVAVDPKVIPLGSKVIINGHEYIAEDIGGAIDGNRIDILFPTHQDALNFGIQYAEVAIVKE